MQQDTISISKCRWHKAMSLLYQQAHSFALAGKLFIYNANFNLIVALFSTYLFLCSSPKPFPLFVLVFHAGLSALILQPKACVPSLQEAAGFTVLSGIPKAWLYFQK